MRQRRIAGQLVVAMKPSQPLPPFRIERAPRGADEDKAGLLRCQQIVFRLQGAILTWKQIEQRAEKMWNDAKAEASRKVREVTKAPTVITRPDAGDGLQRTPGGIIIPEGSRAIVADPHGAGRAASGTPGPVHRRSSRHRLAS